MGGFHLMLLTLVFPFLLYTNNVESARILCVSHQFGSHMLMVHTAVEELIARGHEVYTIFSDIMPVPKGLEETGFKILKYHTPGHSRIMSDPQMEGKVLQEIFDGIPQDFSILSLACMRECYDMDNDKKLEKQIFDLNFDIAVVDVFPVANCLTFLPLKLKIPFVVVPPVLDMEVSRTPLLPSFYPAVLLLYSDNMSFKERIINTYFTAVLTTPALSPFPALRDKTLLEKYNNDPSVTTWNSLTRKALLVLISRGGIVEYPVPMNPNVINIECLTCKPGKPLPNDIQEMADSSSGIIVVSFGSLITHLPDQTAEKFLAAFAKRKELIFWRYKAKLPGQVPPNVKVMKWLPQNDLLAHPKTKLFITHGGNNGHYESVYHGIPMLTFPLFAEQHHNAHRMTVQGFGLGSHIIRFTTEELVEQIDTIINEPRFHEKTQLRSQILKKRPMDARETAAYWIEHVLEFGADHLRSHALDMPTYSFLMFDIILLVYILITAFVLIVVVVSYFIFRKMFSSSKAGKVKQN